MQESKIEHSTVRTFANAAGESGRLMDGLATFIDGFVKLVKATHGLILVIPTIVAICTIPWFANEPAKSPIIPSPLPPDVQKEYSQTLDVSGTWYDDANEAFQISQEGTALRINLNTQVYGVPANIEGVGQLAGNSVHLETNYNLLGQVYGPFPMDITFLNNRKATLAMTFQGVLLANTTIYR